MARTVVFRADASAQIGIGHVMRCLTLAGELARRGWVCRFACAPGTTDAARALAASGFEVVAAIEPAALHAAFAPPDWLVVDHYGLDEGFERALAGWAGRILVLDDLADRPHACHMLMDQTVGQEAGRYAGLVPEGATVLAGPRFALLRDDFARAAPPPDRRPVSRILVSLGGSDPVDATGVALDALGRAGLGIPVVVVMGSAAPHLERVRARAARLTPPAEVLTDVANMAGLMAGCGLAVGAAGTSALERCRMGLPTVAVVIADNQRLIAQGLERAGAARVSALEAGALAGHLADLAGNAEARARLARAARTLCDGQGAARLADLMGITLSPACEGDGEDLLAWRNDPVTRANSLETGAVERDSHFAWLARVLADRDRLLLIARLDGKGIGMARFDLVAEGEWRVSISIAPWTRGRGLGRAVLAQAIARLDAQRGRGLLLADIREGNSASRRIFEECGFALTDSHDGVLHFQRPA